MREYDYSLWLRAQLYQGQHVHRVRSLMTCYKGYYDLVDAGYRTESQVETRAAQVERELRQLLEERRREQMG